MQISLDIMGSEMWATETNQSLLRRGRNCGAVLGLSILFPLGISPGFYIGSYGSLLLLSNLAGPLEHGLAVRICGVMGGVTAMLLVAALSIVAGSVIGTASAYAVALLKARLAKGPEVRFGTVGNSGIGRRLLTAETEAAIRSRQSFSGLHREAIHSISVIGSSAYNAADKDSDIDIVIICKESGYSSVRESLCEGELEESLQNSAPGKIEYIVLTPCEAESLVMTGSPFGWSIRHGAVLEDDGYLRKLFEKARPSMPPREYYSKAFRENVAYPYLGSILAIEKAVRKKGCSLFCCSRKDGCGGLRPAGAFGVVIMRMLYITLPWRGCMPLTKADVLEFVKDIYGEENRAALAGIMPLIRGDASMLYYEDYKVLRSFARRLFSETLTVVGKGKEIGAILRDSARIARGDFRNIEDAAFRRCVK